MAKFLKRFLSIEYIMELFGSWPALVTMGSVSIIWFGWDHFRHVSTDNLDLSISVWTMLLDVLVIIGANYTRQKDHKLLKDIHRHILELKRD